MNKQLRTLARLARPAAPDEATDPDDADTSRAFTPLRLLVAELLLTTGAGATLDYLRREDALGTLDNEDVHAPRAPRRHHRRPYAAVWAPLLIGPAAAIANAVHAVRPSESTRAASRVLNAAAVGVGLAGVADAVYARLTRGESPSLAPIALGSAALLGSVLELEERRISAEHEELERRARRTAVVERLMPKRRAKLDRIVVHV